MPTVYSQNTIRRLTQMSAFSIHIRMPLVHGYVLLAGFTAPCGIWTLPALVRWRAQPTSLEPMLLGSVAADWISSYRAAVNTIGRTPKKVAELTEQFTVFTVVTYLQSMKRYHSAEDAMRT